MLKYFVQREFVVVEFVVLQRSIKGPARLKSEGGRFDGCTTSGSLSRSYGCNDYMFYCQLYIKCAL